MKLFTRLFTDIDQTTRTNGKVAALKTYLDEASPTDKVYAISILIGNRPRRPVKTSELKTWAAEIARLPLWLFEESYYIVGDLAETIACILPPAGQSGNYSLAGIITTLRDLQNRTPEEKKTAITGFWMSMTDTERFVFNKLITGSFRMGVSRQLVVKAIAQHLRMDEATIAHRLMGKWDPDTETMETLFGDGEQREKHHQPYPFFLAYPLEDDPATLGDIGDWIIEKKLDGIRGQIIVRQEDLFVWSRGEDLLTDKFPEFMPLRELLPHGTVIDGEILPWKDGRPLPFQAMQTRIGRKNLSARLLREVPLVMVCYDLLEWAGEDIRTQPLVQRRKLLSDLLAIPETDTLLLLSGALQYDTWDEVSAFRRTGRDHHCEGVMIKKKDSVYETGRRRGNWWKWKTDPMTIDGVLLYAQSGHGRRANLYTDYTFAVWDDEGQLVPFAKAYSGLSDKEIAEVDRWVKSHTIEKFGPVRSVTPELVFELAFEGINRSPRHKSGVALRFPRILRWRRDKVAAEANTRADLLSLLETSAS